MCCWTCGQWLNSFEESIRNILILSLESELLSKRFNSTGPFITYDNSYISYFTHNFIILLIATFLYRKHPVSFKRNKPHFILDANGDVSNSMNVLNLKLFCLNNIYLIILNFEGKPFWVN